jgi:Zn-dependent peptidase ImmA (M78 family)
MNWPDAHRAAMIAAADAQEELQLDTFQRVDVFDAMASAGLRVIFRKLEGCAALYLPSSLSGRPGAIINASHPLALQRYSAGHETGHHFFGHTTQVIRDAEPQRATPRLSEQEMLAEAFAAWFLMPPEGVEQALASMNLTHPRSPADVYELALRVGTSYQATCVHLPNLKLLHAGKSTEWSKLSLKDIKQHLSGHGPPPGGWRNDIWVLSPADKDRMIVVRAGDRFLLDVAGAEVQTLPVGASSMILQPADLLSASRLQVDLSPDTDAGPASILLEHDGQTLELALNVERPRTGRYVPARKVTA